MGKAFPLLAICAATLLSLPLANADQACEDFVQQTLSEGLAPIQGEGSDTPAQPIRFERMINDHMDVYAIAKFTFGKYYKDVPESDFRLYQAALIEHFSKVVSQNLEGSHRISAEVLSSIDRTKSDCIVESAIYRDGYEDALVLWRVIRRGDEHHIVDIALKENGNQIWLSIELRAQVMVVYERTSGDVSAIIQELGLS